MEERRSLMKAASTCLCSLLAAPAAAQTRGSSFAVSPYAWVPAKPAARARQAVAKPSHPGHFAPRDKSPSQYPIMVSIRLPIRIKVQ